MRKTKNDKDEGDYQGEKDAPASRRAAARVALQREAERLRGEGKAGFIEEGLLLLAPQPARRGEEELGRVVFWLGDLPQEPHAVFRAEGGFLLTRPSPSLVTLAHEAFPASRELLPIPERPSILAGAPQRSPHPKRKERKEAWPAVSPPQTLIASNFEVEEEADLDPTASPTSRAKAKARTIRQRYGLPRRTRRTDTAPLPDKTEAGIAALADDEELQETAARLVSRLAKDKGLQSLVGRTIAGSTDNTLIAKMATNADVQERVASSVASAATNKNVQRKVGSAFKKLAENEQLQQKAVSVFSSLLSSAVSSPREEDDIT